MDAGRLDERASLLRLAKTEEGYTWEKAFSLPVQAQRSGRANLFSRVGLGEKSATFTLRRRPLTLHDALLWRGQHCFLTDIRELDRKYLEVEAALVRVQECALLEREKTVDAYNSPQYGEPKRLFSFPGIPTEKYLRYEAGLPMAQNESLFVLVTPKAVELQTGDLVEMDRKRYAVRVCHLLDAYKNEYEIARREDAGWREPV